MNTACWAWITDTALNGGYGAKVQFMAEALQKKAATPST